MSEQRHIIKRQILELEVQGTAEARQLQAEMSRIYRRQIVPLIDRYCTELSAPDRIHRIESLEIDLGYVDPHQLEADVVAKVSTLLRQALSAQINQQEQTTGRREQSSKTMSQLELFTFFVQTGSLPWWVDASQPQLLDDCLQYLLQTAPELLRRSMAELVREQRALQRLVYHYNDEQLSDLSGLLIPSLQTSLSNAPLELIQLLKKTGVSVGKRPTFLRRSVWANILAVAGLSPERPTQPDTFYQMILVRVAAEMGTTYRSLILDILQVLQKDGQHVSSQFQHIINSLYQKASIPKEATPPPEITERWEQRQSKMGSDDSPDRSETTEPEVIIKRLEQLQAEGYGPVGLWAVLRALTHWLAASTQRELLALLNELANEVSTGETVSPKTIQRILRVLRPVLVGQSFKPTVSDDLLHQLQNLEATEFPSKELSELSRLLREALSRKDRPQSEIDETPLDLSFSDADELYIDNAGLVILWPYLSHFFARLGLLEGNRFIDAAARQRAVGLLQYIATEDAVFPEYLLPLNKVLCGMALAEVFDFGLPLAEAEAEECNTLIAALIENAPILRNMSVSGFRGTFLLRQGVLSSRDGAWLLRVERETYDVVLDRFPWSWEWLNLPWMEAPLQVEW